MRPSRLIVGEVRQAECLDPSRCRLSILGLIAYFLQLDLWTRTGVGVTPVKEGGKRYLRISAILRADIFKIKLIRQPIIRFTDVPLHKLEDPL